MKGNKGGEGGNYAKTKYFYNLLRFVPVMILGAFIMALSFGASTVQAETVNEEQVVGGDTAVSADNGGGAVIVLMGGMLLIIIAVVLSVVATVVSSVAAVEAGDEA